MRRWTSTFVAIMIAAAMIDVSVATAQDITGDSARVLVRTMLARSPLLRDTETVVEDANYVASVRDLLSRLAVPDTAVAIRTALDAARVLEKMLIPDMVSIRLESEPAGFAVSYYRIIDGPQSGSVAITDTILRLPAGLYRFGFTNSATAELRTQGRACVEDCRLRWRN